MVQVIGALAGLVLFIAWARWAFRRLRLDRLDQLLAEAAPCHPQEAECLPCRTIFDVVVPRGGFDDDAELTCPKCGEKTLELLP